MGDEMSLDFLAPDNPVMQNVNVMRPYLDVLDAATRAARDGVAEIDLEGQARIDYLTSCRNRGLANQGIGVAFMGTIFEEPTTTVDELKARGIRDAEAEMLISQRDAVRVVLKGLV